MLKIENLGKKRFDKILNLKQNFNLIFYNHIVMNIK